MPDHNGQVGQKDLHSCDGEILSEPRDVSLRTYLLLGTNDASGRLAIRSGRAPSMVLLTIIWVGRLCTGPCPHSQVQCTQFDAFRALDQHASGLLAFVPVEFFSVFFLEEVLVVVSICLYIPLLLWHGMSYYNVG